jgi:hypothetical protein
MYVAGCNIAEQPSDFSTAVGLIIGFIFGAHLQS